VTSSPIAVVLPGTGSDDVFVTSVFRRPLAAVGVRLVAPAPMPGPTLADAYLAALSRAAAGGPILVGGISLGAHVATEWALRNPHDCAGLLLALPAWHGRPDGHPAAFAARHSAHVVRTRGIERALSDTAAAVSPWLATELARAWRRYGPWLAGALEHAATRDAPTTAALRGVRVPAGIAACVDDPIHPAKVAEAWSRALPTAGLISTTLRALAADRESLGRATVLAWLRAGGRP